MIGAGPYRSRQSGASQASSARQPGVWRVRRHVEATGLATVLLRHLLKIGRGEPAVPRHTVNENGYRSSDVSLDAGPGRLAWAPTPGDALPLLARDRSRGADPRFTSAAKADRAAAQSVGGSDTHRTLPQRPERIGRRKKLRSGARLLTPTAGANPAWGARNARLAAWSVRSARSEKSQTRKLPIGAWVPRQFKDAFRQRSARGIPR